MNGNKIFHLVMSLMFIAMGATTVCTPTDQSQINVLWPQDLYKASTLALGCGAFRHFQSSYCPVVPQYASPIHPILKNVAEKAHYPTGIAAIPYGIALARVFHHRTNEQKFDAPTYACFGLGHALMAGRNLLSRLLKDDIFGYYYKSRGWFGLGFSFLAGKNLYQASKMSGLIKHQEEPYLLEKRA